MKLERVALTGFLSHRSTDWSPNGARLISLIGANGAGKSTLASDALTYALWDTARGKTDDVVTLGQTDTSVLVEFTFTGHRYRVERGRTTKAGGKSRLEFAIQGADGAWLPLTRDSIRETQAAIAELLRLDADTFATAVLLGQGQANRFAEATAGDRKRILSTVLGLDVYAAAEARARELARDLEATSAAKRSFHEQLQTQAAGLEEIETAKADAADLLGRILGGIAERRTALAAIENRIRELDVALAASEALAGQVDALEADRVATGESWRAVSARIHAAQTVAGDSQLVLADAGAIAAAAADLPAARGEVEALVAFEAEDRRLVAENRAARQTVLELERPYEQAVTAWRVRHDAAVAKVAELEAHGKAGTSVCVACGQPIVQKTALEQLAAARAALAELGEQPPAPIAIARAYAVLARIESRQRELDWDPGAMIAAQAELARVSAIAARGETMAAAQKALDRAIADVAAGIKERDGLADRGAAIAARIDGLRSEIARVEPFRAERSAAGGTREGLIAELDGLDRRRQELERTIAMADARLDQLRAAASHAGRIRDELAVADTELGLLRRLVQAFGVTGIPARIIEGVLPELASYANELLGELRPGMTLELRAQRAKKDGKGLVEALDLVVRDAAGERPLALFSGGERMSVSLALAVALSRLVARRAGARIESLVVDEPDGLDAAARRAFGQALRVIAHRGDLSRVVVVSHHDDLAEFGDATYSVTKGPQGSVVELVT